MPRTTRAFVSAAKRILRASVGNKAYLALSQAKRRAVERRRSLANIPLATEGDFVAYRQAMVHHLRLRRDYLDGESMPEAAEGSPFQRDEGDPEGFERSSAAPGTRDDPNDLALTIVTPTLDRADFIERALDSVAEQRTADVEHIVVDGGSRDGTLETIRARKNVQLIVDETPGMYGALNRGIDAARGRWIMFLNSDDWLLPGAIDAIRRTITRSEDKGDVDCICGTAILYECPEAGLGTASNVIEKARYSDPSVKALSPWAATFGPAVLNGRIFKRSFLTQLGKFNAGLQVAGDREMLLCALLAGMRIETTENEIYGYLFHDGSITLNADFRRNSLARQENLAVSRGFLSSGAGSWPPSKENRELFRWVRRWHAVGSAMTIRERLRDGRIKDLMSEVGQSFSSDPFWPILLSGEMMRRLSERSANW